MTRETFDRKLAVRAERLAAGDVEAWATVNGFARYEVSAWGFIRNRSTGRFLKPFVHCAPDPYLRVSLYKAAGPNVGRAFHRFAHRLVALYHTPGRSRHRCEVHHVLDPVTLRPDLEDLAADSLAWVTPEENRRCRGAALPDGTTGPGRLLAEVRAEVAAEDAAWRRSILDDPAWSPAIPYAETAPF